MDCGGDGDPVATRGHKKQKLSGDDQTKLYRTLDHNHFATNRELRAVVENKIAECSVSRYLAHAKPCFTTKVVQDQEPEELSDGWKTATRAWLEGVRRIPLHKRIYQDETPIYANEAPKRGRSRKGEPIFRARKRYAKKNTRCICTPSGMVCYTGTCLAKTLILQRLNAWLRTQLERWKVVIRSSGTVWVGAGVHNTRLPSTTAQMRKPRSRNVA